MSLPIFSIFSAFFLLSSFDKHHHGSKDCENCLVNQIISASVLLASVCVVLSSSGGGRPLSAAYHGVSRPPPGGKLRHRPRRLFLSPSVAPRQPEGSLGIPNPYRFPLNLLGGGIPIHLLCRGKVEWSGPSGLGSREKPRCSCDRDGVFVTQGPGERCDTRCVTMRGA